MEKNIFLASMLSVLLCATINSNNNAMENKSGSMDSLLEALQVLASDKNALIINDLKELLSFLKVDSVSQAVAYVTQMQNDLETLIAALGAQDYEEGLMNAQQYKSVFEQVRMLKDSIRK